MTDAAEETTPADAPVAPASLLHQLQALARELPGLVSDRVELLSLELQRAAQSLAQIAVLTVAIAILGVTVWLALWAVLISLLMQAGLPLVAALLLTVGVNCLVIAAAVARVHQLLPRLQLPATRRHLMVSPHASPSPKAPPDDPSPSSSPTPSVVAGQPAAP